MWCQQACAPTETHTSMSTLVHLLLNAGLVRTIKLLSPRQTLELRRPLRDVIFLRHMATALSNVLPTHIMDICFLSLLSAISGKIVPNRSRSLKLIPSFLHIDNTELLETIFKCSCSKPVLYTMTRSSSTTSSMCSV